MSGEEKKGKSIAEFFEGEVKQEREYKLELIERIRLDDQVSRILDRAVQDTATLATVVIDYLGLSGEERTSAEEVIGRAINGGKEGDLEALRTLIFLVAHQIKSQRKWRWVTSATLLVAIISLIVSLIR